MNDLEGRYRAALRWYPVSWREANEDVVLSTLLDVAEAEGRDHPSVRERVDLAAHGVRISLERGLPRSVRDRASALALGMGTGFAAVYLFFFELDGIPRAAARAEKIELVFGPDGDFGWGPFASSAALVMLAWFLAFVAGILGGRRIMLAALALSVGAAIATMAGGDASWAVLRPSATILWVLGGLAMVAAIGDPGRSPRHVGWTAISGVLSLTTIVGFMLPTLGMTTPPPGRYFLELSVNLFEVAAVMGVMLVVAVAARRGDWFLACLLVTLPWALPIVLHASVQLSDAWGLLYSTLLAIIILVPTVEWLRRRIRSADARMRERRSPASRA